VTTLVLVTQGCNKPGPGLLDIPCDLTVGPAVGEAVDPNNDTVKDIALGAEGAVPVFLSANDADCRVIDVSVLNLVGDYFFAPESVLDIVSDACEDKDVEDTRLTLAEGTRCDFFIPYRPDKAGYHQAQLQVTYDGSNTGDSATTEIRGHCDEPDANVFPWTIDFGSVKMGETRRERVTISNESTIPLFITDIRFLPEASNPFTISEALPIRVEPNDTVEVDIAASPVNALQVDEPYSATMTLLSGQEVVQNVRLRMNDCANGTPSAYDRDQDGFTVCGGDCDDTNASVRPGAIEIPDLADNDCNSRVDDTTPGYDDDGDGYCDHPTTCTVPAVLPADCNDGDQAVHPGVAEVLGDGIDNDCDGSVDGGTLDYDGDGYTEGAGDCEPYDPDVFPDAPELADGKDNDCDTFRDEGTVLFDDDGDGYCEGLPAGGAPCTDNAILGDCNDTEADTRPGAPERDDWRDNDCDNAVDEGTQNYDDDGDGYTERGGDCDDRDADVGPQAFEVPNDGVDNDCDDSTPAGGGAP
jgi:hypothetical protein